MKCLNSFQPITLLFLFLLFFACNNVEQVDKNQLLFGHWEIENATRDGTRAPSVEGLFFTFFQDGTLQTNIAGSAETASYQVEGSVIQQRESRFEVDYTIEELSDSTLILTTELRSALFRFSLKKKVTEE